jgi:hypothetical protein
MNLRLHQFRRLGLIPIAVLTLAAYYLLVYRPLGQRAAELDAPLQKAWQSLALSLEQSNAPAISFLRITNQLAETRTDIARLEYARRKAAARLELPPVVRARMSMPFQLYEFQNERGKELEDLAKLAKKLKLPVEPPVLAGYPEHTADMREPILLWPALSMANGLVLAAVQCKIGALHSLEVSLALTNTAGRLVSIPVQMEFTGPASAVETLLQMLPLRPEEIKAAGYPELTVEKPPLFVDRLVIKRQSPDKPDEVRVLLRVVGFVMRE